jgi:hypothetical protein
VSKLIFGQAERFRHDAVESARDDVDLSLWVTDARPAVLALAGIVAAAAALALSVIDVARDIGDSGWPRKRASNRPTEGDQWVRQLRSQMTGARQTGSTVLRDRLVFLLDARLSVPLDIDRHAPPMFSERAQTPTLRDLRTGSPRRLGSLRTLEQIINDIEAL